MDFGPSARPGAEMDPPTTEVAWLEPYPDQWLLGENGEYAASAPEARYEQRESVELAFLIALQQLPPLQRAVLLLREVVGLSTAEISANSRPRRESVNSALQRARASVQDRRQQSELSQQATLRELGEQRVRALAERYADAIERADIEMLISMLTEDASWSMPPVPTWFHGHEAVRDFLVRFPLQVTWRHRISRANGQLALGCYLYDADKAAFIPWVIDVLTLQPDEKISAVTAFFGAEAVGPEHNEGWIPGAELFARFGMPATVE